MRSARQLARDIGETAKLFRTDAGGRYRVELDLRRARIRCVARLSNEQLQRLVELALAGAQRSTGLNSAVQLALLDDAAYRFALGETFPVVERWLSEVFK